MSALPSAEIIAFPKAAKRRSARPARQPAQSAADIDAQERLRSALARLNEALAAQRLAVAQWRGALAGLHSTVQGLGGSLRTYHDALGTLAGQIGDANGQAHRLEAWADRALADDAARSGE
jgi:hypothetical protein